MSRLVVNPGTPQAWEIQLKPGTNLLGRRTDCDFKIEEPSVSGSHCQIEVGNDSVVIRDLGSTNGTFVNRAPIQEARLETGQTVHLGGVEMVFYFAAREPMRVVATGPPPPPAASPAPPPLPAPVESTVTAFIPAGPRFCKFHPKSPARYLCNKCNRTFCELCITVRTVGGAVTKNCRTCGVECVPLHVQLAHPTAAKGFFARIPGAFAYPVRGNGILMLIVGMLIFAGLRFGGGMVLGGGLRGIGMGVVLQVIVGGYLFTYLQNIIHSTAAGDEHMPDLPGINFLEDILLPFFRLLGLVLVCFGPFIGLVVWAVAAREPALAAAIFPAALLGCFYFPMALLAVAMMDSVIAANPLVIIPSILKVPLEYMVTVILLACVLALSHVGDILVATAFPEGIMTRDAATLVMMFGAKILSSLLNLYLLTVNMRLLGLLYVTKKEKFGWLKR